MVAIARADADALVSQVGYKLGFTLTTSTVPTVAQVKSWLQDGFLRLMNVLPLPMLASFIEVQAVTGPVAEFDLTSNMLRIVSITRGGIPARIVGPIEFAMAKALTYNDPLAKQSIATISSEDGVEKVEVWPSAAGGDWVVSFIAAPSAVADWPNAPYSPLLMWQDALVSYATYEARMQDEEPGLAADDKAEWESKLAELIKNAVYSVSVEVAP